MYTEQQMQFLHEIFDASFPRLGPGDETSTLKAWDILRPIVGRNESPIRILDVGCGNGAQTLCLARHVDGSILAVDNHQPYLDELQRRADIAGVSDKIQVSLRDMRTLTKDDGPFDLVWSEGALFAMGFREGVSACHALLSPGGGLAVSELAWLRSDPPAECRQFWAEVYPAMMSIAANLAAIDACGYEVIEHFVEPESAWWDPCYHPLEARLDVLRKRYAEDAEKATMIEMIQKEIDIRRRYSAFTGNVFYVMRRR